MAVVASKQELEEYVKQICYGRWHPDLIYAPYWPDKPGFSYPAVVEEVFSWEGDRSTDIYLYLAPWDHADIKKLLAELLRKDKVILQSLESPDGT